MLTNARAGDSYTLSLKEFEVASKLQGYQVVEVYSATAGQKCIGFVYRGMLNKMVSARMSPTVESDVGECLKRSFPRREYSIPLTIRINRIRIYEITGSSVEKAFAEVSLSFLARRGDSLQELFTAGRSIRRNGMDVTGGHEKSLAQMLAACFDDFADALSQGVIAQKMIPGDSLRVNPLDRLGTFPVFRMKRIPKGLFRSFYDFRDGRPDTVHTFTIICRKQKKDTSCARADLEVQDSTLEGDWFGFSDGRNLYVNLRKHYARVTVSDEKILLALNRDEIGNGSGYSYAGVALGAMFGALGGLVGGLIDASAAKAGESSACIIDMTSGQLFPEKVPQYLDMVSNTVLFLSKTSASGAELVVRSGPDTVCTLSPGNLLHLRLPAEYEAADLKFDGPKVPAVTRTFLCEPFTWDVWIVKIKRNGEISFMRAYEQVKRDLVSSLNGEGTIVVQRLGRTSSLPGQGK